jgi:hypothetical protein
MYEHWSINGLVVLSTAVLVALSVLVHYEGLQYLSIRLPMMRAERRRKVLYGVYAVIFLHVIEIWLFGLGIWLLLMIADAGSIFGITSLSLLDAVYLSATTFTTVGFGDVAPTGPIRFLSGTEALVGFILITWSASFLYLEMRQFWRNN